MGAGVVIENKVKIAIDVPRPLQRAVHIVTHAHADHTGALRGTVGYAAPDTSALLRARGLSAEPVEVLRAGPMEIRFSPSGHIAASHQVAILDGIDIVITGDFKFEGDPVGGKPDILNPDILIIDTTFSHPAYNFPLRRTIYKKIINFVFDNLSAGRVPVLFAYEVGKSQELTALLNSYGVIPYTTPVAHRVNTLLGLKSVPLRGPPSRGVLILPPKFMRVLDALSLQAGKEFRGMFCSGWNPTCPLSSHADWKQTVKFVERASPELVITYGENAVASARFLKQAGFNALPLRGKIVL